MMDTHKALFAGELLLTGKEVCKWLYIIPLPCGITESGRLFPTRSLQERYSTRLRTWRRYWRRITRVVEQDKGYKRNIVERITALEQRYICFKCRSFIGKFFV